MLYGEYKEKLEKRRRVFERVWHFRALIIACMLLLLATVGALLGVKGIVYGLSAPQSVEYGVEYEISAKAVLGKAVVQYRPEGGEWSENKPVAAGRYECRAIGRGAFGAVRESGVCEFEITRAPCVIVIDEDTLEYGEIPRFSAQLRKGDTLIIKDYTLVYEDGKTKISIATDGISAISQSGEDMALSYEFEAQDKEVLSVLRSIVVRTATAEFTYDGRAHSANSAVVTSPRNLAEGDRLEIVTPELTEAGETVNGVQGYKIYNEAGGDVTEHYSVNFTLGTLRVNRRPITVRTASDEFTYDGKEHSYGPESLEVISGGLVEGQELFCIAPAAFTEANESGYTDNIGFGIRERAGGIKTQNYEISHSFGKITINRRIADIYSADKELEYNGKAQGYSAGDYSAERAIGAPRGLIEGHVLSVTEPFAAVDAGTYANEPALSVTDGTGRDVTANYKFGNIGGSLKITPRRVKFFTVLQTAEYDATPHRCEKFYASSDFPLLSGHAAYPVFPAHTEVGVYNDLPSGLTIYEGAKDVTRNYAPEWEIADFGITQREISVFTGSGEHVYDGAPYFNAAATAENVLAGHKFISTVTNFAQITNIGEKQNICEVSWQITDSDGNDVTGNYTLPAGNITYGNLKVTPRPLSLFTEGFTEVYDGKEHKPAEGGLRAENLAPGERIEFEILSESPSIRDVGSRQNVVYFDYEIYGKDGGKTKDNYVVDGSVNYGLMVITPRPITVKTKNVTAVYDALPHFDESREITTGDIADGQQLELEFGSLTEAGSMENRPVSHHIYDGAGSDVTHNYEVTFDCGTITVEKRVVTYDTESGKFTYDGAAHYRTNHTLAAGSCAPVEGHKVSLVYKTFTDAGEYENTPEVNDITDEKGVSVKNNYDVRFNSGSIVIDKRRVTLTMKSAGWMYDGEAHTFIGDGAYDVTDGSFVNGHGVTGLGGWQFEKAGEWPHTPTGDRDVYTREGASVGGNYELTWVDGKITIEKKPVQITTLDVQWVYDSQNHITDESVRITYTGGSLGHTVLFSLERFTEAGTYTNTCNGVTILRGSDDVSENYEITVLNSGKVTIDKRYVRFTTYGATSDFFNDTVWVYDGQEHSYGHSSYTITDKDRGLIPKITEANGEITEHHFIWSDIAKVKDITDTELAVGYADNVFNDLKIVDQNNNDVTKNYDLVFNWGKLRVKSPIVINVSSVSKPYDGEPLELTDYDWYIAKKPPDTKAENIKVSLKGQITEPGSLKLSQVQAQSSYTVTGESVYRVDFAGNENTLEITRRKLVITTATITAERGDNPVLGSSASVPYWISYGTLLSGHSLSNFVVTGVLQPEYDQAANTLAEGYTVIDGKGEDVGRYYEIIVVLGTLNWTG